MLSLSLLLSGCGLEYGIDKKNDADVVDTGTGLSEFADAPLYANTTSDLYEVDPSNGQPTHIGSFHSILGVQVEGMVDIAIDLDGRLFGGTFDALYQIHPGTAEVAAVCATDIEMLALTFTDDGQLVAGGDSGVVLVDPDTCTQQVLVSDDTYKTSGDVVGLPDGYLYWTVEGTNGDELVQIDPADGSTRWIGPIGVSQLYGLGYDEGQLYGFSAAGHIVRISPTEAQGIVTAEEPQLGWWGATTNPVVW